jgi:hypothetical protein
MKINAKLQVHDLPLSLVRSWNYGLANVQHLCLLNLHGVLVIRVFTISVSIGNYFCCYLESISILVSY